MTAPFHSSTAVFLAASALSGVHGGLAVVAIQSGAPAWVPVSLGLLMALHLLAAVLALRERPSTRQQDPLLTSPDAEVDWEEVR